MRIFHRASNSVQNRIARSLINRVIAATIVLCLSGGASTSVIAEPSNSIVLNWTAPGDDGSKGSADCYDIRYSDSAITVDNWDGASVVPDCPAPQPAGAHETFEVAGLAPNTTYFFAVKAADERSNWSPISNIAVVTTSDATNPGYVPGDGNNDGSVDISDLMLLLDFMFSNAAEPTHMDALDVNGDCNIDIADLLYAVDYLFVPGSPALLAGCVEEDMPQVARVASNVEIAAQIEDGSTIIILDSPVPLRGVQLELIGEGAADAQSLLSAEFDLFCGGRSDSLRVGLLDLEGQGVIASGATRIIRIAGEFELASAVVADDQNRALRAEIVNGAAKILPEAFELAQNYPNPFNPSTEISFSLPDAGHVNLTVFNVLGQAMATLVDERLEAGTHSRGFDGGNRASGVYFYRLSAGGQAESRKMILLK